MPRIPTLPPRRTLKQRQQETGRTLALNGAPWRRLRRSVLDRSPLCRHCTDAGRITLATEVDHRDNDPTNNAETNLDALCKPCHSRKTAADQGATVRVRVGLDGWPVEG